MDFSNYVARRMLCEICEIATPLNPLYEPGYNALFNWMEHYTERFGTIILPNLPRLKATPDELLNDMLEIYSGIFEVVYDINAMVTLNSLFTISFYMMVKYKERLVMCSNISYYFELITRRLGSWDYLTNNYEVEV